MITSLLRTLHMLKTPKNTFLPVEWKKLEEVLGMRLLCKMMGLSRREIKLYSQLSPQRRKTPQDMLLRLQWLDCITEHLQGSYSKAGTKNWFQRPRTALSGRTPLHVIQSNLNIHDENMQEVLRLSKGG